MKNDIYQIVYYKSPEFYTLLKQGYTFLRNEKGYAHMIKYGQYKFFRVVYLRYFQFVRFFSRRINCYLRMRMLQKKFPNYPHKVKKRTLSVNTINPVTDNEYMKKNRYWFFR